jgi:hypothetical protein
MKYLDEVWYLLFSPGKRDCIMGYSHHIITEEDEDVEDKEYDPDMEDEDDDIDMDDEEDDKVTQDEAVKEVKGLEEEEKEHKKGDEEKDNEEDAEGDEDMQDKGLNQKQEKVDEEVKKEKEDQADEDEDDEKDEGDEPEEPGAAKEVVLAEEFDAILKQDVSRGRHAFVKLSKKLAGWSASTLAHNLAVAQYAEAMMTLPTSHPAFTAFMSNMFSRF